MDHALNELDAADSGRVSKARSDLSHMSRSGQVLANRFVLRGLLGSGGMGEVYEAEHVRLHKRFALKLLRHEYAHDPRTVERFAREARAVAMLQSDHVVSVVDCDFTDDGTPFFVMERLHGMDLRELLQRSGPLAVPRAVSLILDACCGLRHAHRVGLIHRDLKPSNLFVVTSDRGVEMSKVLDFGVAKLLSTDSTKPGGLIGTIRYMAPEQLRDGGQVDHRTDVYALGAILYECLAGRPPFSDAALERVLFAILHESPPSLSDAGALVPTQLNAIITRALARRPEDRFASMDALMEALIPFAGIRGVTPVALAEADDPTFDTQLPRLSPRRSMATLFSIGAGLGVASAFLLVAVRGHESHAKLREVDDLPTVAGSACITPAAVTTGLPAEPAPLAAVASARAVLAASEEPAAAKGLRPRIVRESGDRPRIPIPPASAPPASAPPESESPFDFTSPYAASTRSE